MSPWPGVDRLSTAAVEIPPSSPIVIRSPAFQSRSQTHPTPFGKIFHHAPQPAAPNPDAAVRQARRVLRSRALRRPCALDDDISPCAGDYGLDLCLFGLGHSELVKGLLEIVEKGLPLGRSDHQILVRVLHGTAGVLLRPTSSPADHFSDEVFEACRGNTMMGFIYPWVCIQAGSTMIRSMKSSITVAML